jgi:hypothetical protein
MPTLSCRFSFADFLMPFRARRRHPAPDPRPTTAPAATPVPSLSSELEELRGAAMRRLFPKLHAWGRRSALAFMLQAYGYLAEATSVDDLERRIRVVERQQHFRH